MKSVLLSLARIADKLEMALHSVWGWILVAITSVATFLQPEAWSFYVVAGAVAADLFWGILAAIKLKKFILSKALRETVKKVGIYAYVMIGLFAIEKITHTEGSFIALRTIAIFAAVCELWSMSGSMLIVKPNMPFLKLFRGQLKGEIAAKVSKNVNIDDILEE